MDLTSEQKDVIVGTILGDACIEKAKPTHNARIRFDQTFPFHATYLMRLYIIFHNMVKRTPKVHIRKEDKRTGKRYSTMRFKTLAFPCLNSYFHLFYVNGIKVVPYNIGELLTRRALAYWIIDDGGRSKNGLTLHTRRYTLRDVKILQNVLLNNFNLTSSLQEKTPGLFIFLKNILNY